MAGFRDLHTTAGVLRLLNLPWSDQLAARLVDGPAEVALREVTTDLLGLSGRPLRRVLRDVGTPPGTRGPRPSDGAASPLLPDGT